MLLVDPDDGLTMEQVFEKVWKRLDEQTQAEILAVAEAKGCTWQDVIAERVEESQERRRADPLVRQRYEAHLDWVHSPYGKDPRLSPPEGRP